MDIMLSKLQITISVTNDDEAAKKVTNNDEVINKKIKKKIRKN